MSRTKLGVVGILLVAALLALPQAISAIPVDFLQVFGTAPLTCSNNSVSSSKPTCSLDVSMPNVFVTCEDPDGCRITLNKGGYTVNNSGTLVRVFNVSPAGYVVEFADVAGTQEMCGNGTIGIGQYQAAHFMYVTDRWLDERCAVGATRTVPRVTTGITTDPAYFTSGTTVTRYIRPSDGSDSACDGSANVAGGTGACAFATAQRCLDDVPEGYAATVACVFGQAATISTAQVWTLRSRPSADVSVNVVGDCSTPQALMSTTGAGTFVSSNGVTKLAQIQYATPTATSGTIPTTIADGDFWFYTGTDTAPTVRAVLANGGDGLLHLNHNSATAQTSNVHLCPFGTVVNASLQAVSFGSTTATGSNLALRGIKVSSAASHSFGNVSLNGVFVTGATSTNLSSAGMNGGNLFVSSAVTARTVGSTNPVYSLSTFSASTLQLLGTGYSGFTAFVFKGVTSAAKLQLGCASPSQGFGPVALTTFTTSDFEGSGNAICMDGGRLANTSSCGTAFASFDITGSPFDMHRGSYLHLCGATSGKYTVASVVKSGSQVTMATAWSATNTVDANSVWTIGAAGTFATASLPKVDSAGDTAQFARVTTAAD